MFIICYKIYKYSNFEKYGKDLKSTTLLKLIYKFGSQEPNVQLYKKHI